MNLPKNAIDEIKNYELSKMKSFADIQKKHIEIELIMLIAIKEVQKKIANLSDQVIVDTISERFNKEHESLKKDQFALMSMACYSNEGMYLILEQLKEVQNASNDIFERYQNRTETENSEFPHQSSTSRSL